jgi:hypothetical protein
MTINNAFILSLFQNLKVMKPKGRILTAVTFIVMSIFLVYACQKQDFKADHQFSNTEIKTRSTTCNDCEDCCCYVQLDEDDAAILQFCGTANGASACSGVDSCDAGSFLGGGQVLSLSTGNPKQIFCMDNDGPFWIKNFSMSDDADFTLNCDEDSGPALTIHLEPGATQYFQTTSSGCELEDCPN